MENIRNNENKIPNSLRKIGYNTSFKELIQFKNNISISIKNKKILPRAPLKSKMNILCTNPQPLNTKNNKCLNYPLLKSISSSNYYNVNKLLNNLNNNNINEENDIYNENALEDEPEDFMHMNQNEIYLNNEEENQNEFNLKKPKLKFAILNKFNPFLHHGNNNYILGAHFDDYRKKQYDYYFNSTDENDLIFPEI